MMIQFLFFGRLDKEKWRDSIIAMLEYFADKETNTLPFVFHVFGKGSYEKQLFNLAQRYPEHIIYYGFQSLDTIKKTAEQCDYCLMPSVFLETFWLSAVNALARWLPVIGYQKGGMTPFVLDKYNLWSNTGSLDVHLIAMIEKLIILWRYNDSKRCKDIAKNYSKKQWVDGVSNLLDPSLRSGWQKILLVTDFINKLGGIETYVHDVAGLLTEQWHTVEIIWSSWGKTKFSRIISMFSSLWNIFFAWKLHKKIQSFQPDVIWCHSVLRHIGRLGLYVINKSSVQKRMMYHDLGYFAPFPHAISDTIQIPRSIDRKDFSADIQNPITKLLVYGKWILLKLLQKQLKSFDKHLVPSKFMVDVVAKNYNKKVGVLPHFIQE